MPINKASQRGTELGPGSSQKGKSHGWGWKLTVAWMFPAGLIGNSHTHSISREKQWQGKEKPFITHSHKTQVFPTKQCTVKCFRLQNAWYTGTKIEAAQRKIWGCWTLGAGILSLLALCVTGFVCSQLGQEEITRVVREAKIMGFLLLVPMGVLFEWETTQEQKIETSAQNFNVMGPKVYSTRSIGHLTSTVTLHGQGPTSLNLKVSSIVGFSSES